MTVGWILLLCALIILTLMAVKPWLSKKRAGATEKDMFGQRPNFLVRLDEFDARLVRRDEIMSLLSAEQKIGAIKVYREDTGASLADAKAAVERMELSGRIGLASGASPFSETLGSVSSTLDGEIERLLLQGQKIQAIKAYREQTGLGLREAKDAVDLIENRLLAQGPSPFQGQEPEPSLFRAREDDPNTEDGLPRLAVSDEEIRQCLLQGDKIHAIKLYRQQTGLSLREAKEAIDLLEQTLPHGMEPA